MDFMVSNAWETYFLSDDDEFLTCRSLKEMEEMTKTIHYQSILMNLHLEHFLDCVVDVLAINYDKRRK